MNEYVSKLKALANQILSVDQQIIADVVLNDGRFHVWSGSAKPEHHHYGTGELAKHTWEVVHVAFTVKQTLNLKVDDTEVFQSCLFHDIGKIYDYEEKNGVWGGTPHKRLIHHISRSALIWNEANAKYPSFEKKYVDLVLHAILAHHGSREWGSPVAPKTQAAWLLHYSDAISARMDDWNKSDILNH